MNTVATANEQEIRRFNELAAIWWDPTGPMWPLHKLNAIRVPFIVTELARQGLSRGPLQLVHSLSHLCERG